MSMVVNNNMMAANTARNLNAHYGRLATSTQRLSSGLRINSAADDAAGLAIRELQRADIAALHQGARNANDAISMIQVADGALGIIDEKLIRMKELAEQAATGTYDSTQRLMIESEYQAMASEITRIANATDFNGMKLLNGTLKGDHDGSGLTSTGKMKIHFGTGNDSAEDYYYITIGECTAQAFGLGNASTWQDVQNRGISAFEESLRKQIKESDLKPVEQGEYLNQIGERKPDGSYTGALGVLDQVLEAVTNPLEAYNHFKTTEDLGKYWQGNSNLMAEYLAAAADTAALPKADPLPEDSAIILDKIRATMDTAAFEEEIAAALADSAPATSLSPDDFKTKVFEPIVDNARVAAIANGFTEDDANDLVNSLEAVYAFDGPNADVTGTVDVTALIAAMGGTLAGTDAKTAADAAAIANTEVNKDAAAAAAAEAKNANIQKFWDDLSTTQRQKLQYAWGQAAVDKLASGDLKVEAVGLVDADGAPIDKIPFDDQNMVGEALKYMHAQIGHMDFAGHTIETQEDAQHALEAINSAIVEKDKIRAHLGATQNRLENTVSNLNIQAENLQAAESRISDVDVATEMTQFVRNQILTQSAVAMLSQANSLPQMAMQLIGG